MKQKAEGQQREKAKIKSAAALAYRPEQGDKAPRLVAAGRGVIAQEIMQRANAAGIPLQEDAALVECLCRLPLAEEIPPQLYQAVAELLAVIWRAGQGDLAPVETSAKGSFITKY